jgi:hypothetical protein
MTEIERIAERSQISVKSNLSSNFDAIVPQRTNEDYLLALSARRNTADLLPIEIVDVQPVPLKSGSEDIRSKEKGWCIVQNTNEGKRISEQQSDIASKIAERWSGPYTMSEIERILNDTGCLKLRDQADVDRFLNNAAYEFNQSFGRNSYYTTRTHGGAEPPRPVYFHANVINHKVRVNSYLDPDGISPYGVYDDPNKP